MIRINNQIFFDLNFININRITFCETFQLGQDLLIFPNNIFENEEIKWTKIEDNLLINAVKKYKKNWTKIKQELSNKTLNECKKRWYVDINKNKYNDYTTFNDDEINTIIKKRKKGYNWEKISEYLPGRAPLLIKQFYDTLKLS